MTDAVRHLLDLADHTPEDVRSWLDEALVIAEDRRRCGRRPQGAERFLEGRFVTLLLEKPATRTRLHSELATADLGGTCVALPAAETQLSRGESVGDTARVLSKNTDLVLYRARRHEDLLEFARHSSVPVINGCSDFSHPFRVLIDVMTFEQVRGPVAGRTFAWCGDGNNMLNSFIQAATLLDFELRIATPQDYAPNPDVLAWAERHGGKISVHRDPVKAITGAHAVVGDTWVSMGDVSTPERLAAMRPYQVDAELMAKAAPDAVYLHSLPAYRGQEVTADVIDGPQSLVWDGGIANKRFFFQALYRWLLRY
ncbi:ornithine carbamoyltransferase [Actinobacteria bacterium OK074]|nr:ornithine carbamoyltransferase [Actinobacteria bacterium OK074]